MLYKQISKQYVNQDILEYIISLIPEEIVKKTRTEIEDKGSLESILKWFKKDFTSCNGLLRIQSVKDAIIYGFSVN